MVFCLTMKILHLKLIMTIKANITMRNLSTNLWRKFEKEFAAR